MLLQLLGVVVGALLLAIGIISVTYNTCENGCPSPTLTLFLFGVPGVLLLVWSGGSLLSRWSRWNKSRQTDDPNSGATHH